MSLTGAGCFCNFWDKSAINVWRDQQHWSLLIHPLAISPLQWSEGYPQLIQILLLMYSCTLNHKHTWLLLQDSAKICSLHAPSCKGFLPLYSTHNSSSIFWYPNNLIDVCLLRWFLQSHCPLLPYPISLLLRHVHNPPLSSCSWRILNSSRLKKEYTPKRHAFFFPSPWMWIKNEMLKSSSCSPLAVVMT